MRHLTHTQEVDAIRAAFDAAKLTEWTIHPLAVFYTRYENEPFGDAYQLATRILEVLDPLAAQKHDGLSSLDDYNDVSVQLMSHMFLIGIEYGRRLAETPSPLTLNEWLDQRDFPGRDRSFVWPGDLNAGADR